MQIALLAASAAYLRSDLRPSKAGTGGALGRAGSEISSRGAFDDEEDRADMWGLPNGEVKRFVLAEQVSGGEGVKSRTMGSAVGAPVTPRSSTMRVASSRLSPVPSATSLEGRVPVEVVGISSGGEAELPAFDPVPNGEGYSITADAASHFDMGNKTVTFSGNVALQNSAFTLHAKRLVVHLDSESGQMKRMVANGDVDVALTQGEVEQRFRGWGEEAVFEPVSNSIVMQGWPRILGHGREHRAASATTKMTIHLQPSKLVTEGRAQTRILAGADGALPGIGAP